MDMTMREMLDEFYRNQEIIDAGREERDRVDAAAGRQQREAGRNIFMRGVECLDDGKVYDVGASADGLLIGFER